ncbi:hypothetical protein QOZ80_2BG0194500 [Eleusine coracana subsp. coracana]|nr:hypothetical protein QOZ80_2BG0194500 [Eleusine coracana subsp. coracana]
MTMRKAPSPATLMLLLILLLAIELPVFTNGCRTPKSAEAPRHGGAVLWTARAPPSMVPPGASNVDALALTMHGESKRLVPEGPNPLHN